MQTVTIRTTVSREESKRTYTTLKELRTLIKAERLDSLKTKTGVLGRTVTHLQPTVVATAGKPLTENVWASHGYTMLTSSKSELCVSGEEEQIRDCVEGLL
jgi:hypothetical protein